MVQTNHDFYSLEEAAELLDCAVPDFLKWGASGKIKLYVWYLGWVIEPLGLKKRRLLNEFVWLSREDIMAAYINFDSDRLHVTYQITTSSGELWIIDDDDGLWFNSANLYVMADELKTFAPQGLAQESHLSKILDPTHPWHSENLAMAVNAWLELYANREGNRNDSTFKPPGGNTRLIEEWLDERNPNIGKTTKEHFRVIINPDKRGGPNKLSE